MIPTSAYHTRSTAWLLCLLALPATFAHPVSAAPRPGNVTGKGEPLVPEFALSGNGADIQSGSETPSAANGTDFGPVVLNGGECFHTFVVSSPGTLPLHLTGAPRVSIAGAAAADFSVVTQPDSPLAPGGGTAPFQIRFSPSTTGRISAVVLIANDDPDEGAFTFRIWGRGVVAAPTIKVQDPAITGTVVAWGRNYSGQSDVPPNLEDVTAVAAGQEHSVALRSDGTVVAWGDNTYGQTTVPAGLSGVVAISASHHQTVALKNDGTSTGWGPNSYGQNDMPPNLGTLTAVSAGGEYTAALTVTGAIRSWGNTSLGQGGPVTNNSGFIAVSAGGSQTLALDGEGRLRAWGIGGGSSGPANLPTNLTDLVAIDSSANRGVALSAQGVVFAWGENRDGESTLPANLGLIKAISAHGGATLGLRADGTVIGWGPNDYGHASIPAGLTGVTAIAVGYGHSLAVRRGLRFPSLPLFTPSPWKVLTIKNAGTAPLSLAGVSVTGGDAADFTVETAGMAASLPAGDADTTFTVRFTPGGEGVRSATLRVASNDPLEPAFDIRLTGGGLPPLPPYAAWRLAKFGSTDVTSASASMADADGDGLPNLLEFALGGEPLLPESRPEPVVTFDSSRLEWTFIYTRPKAAVIAGVSYRVEWTETLDGVWRSDSLSTETIDLGAAERVTVAVHPLAGHAAFVRLRVQEP